MPFRFVHTADLHLDSPLRSLSLRNPDLAELVGNASRDVLTAIVDLCLEERVDALLVAGDLYDGDQTSMKTARFLAAELARLGSAGIAVFKIRGNHDAEAMITKQLHLPETVHVFGGRAGTVRLPAGSFDVAVHGISFSRREAPESLLPRFSAPLEDAVNIGLLHTSLGGSEGHDTYAPCTLAELNATGFRYWALGHIHKRSLHEGAATVVMPGIPQGRDINEAGAKSVSLVTIGDDGRIAVEERATSVAQFQRVRVDLTGAESEAEARAAVEGALGRARDAAAARHLVARVQLTGATPLSFRLRRDADAWRKSVETWGLGFGTLWLDRFLVETREPAGAESADGADPLVELGRLMRGEVAGRHDVREAVAALAADLARDLPPEIRDFAGADEEAFRRFVDTIIAEGSEDVFSRLAARGGETEEAA